MLVPVTKTKSYKLASVLDMSIGKSYVGNNQQATINTLRVELTIRCKKDLKAPDRAIADFKFNGGNVIVTLGWIEIT